MKRIKSMARNRLIANCVVNGKEAYFLLDTGASAGIMNREWKDKYSLKEGRRFGGTVIGAGGEMCDVNRCDTFAYLEGKAIPQFLMADISNIVHSIKEETGIEILGIISLPQMKIAGIGIDANDMEIIIE